MTLLWEVIHETSEDISCSVGSSATVEYFFKRIARVTFQAKRYPIL